ncbi:hypothetical protein GQA70_08780 [Ponticoccus alexandrii]|uniref:Uncharacterized protein n=1 Tax=Ponticoccus alexandrii TaxID=1943633 RepID=A0ABX7F794_9RHOB|nr:hypothetical protein [Ponticoccus alexandrii]ETA49919.2 hypothetical protein P279_22225 [Rhodobacteraceae bacterium PD-2]QRF66396.1 hypothetical protein GQA70_08780 [Ponticoccus alexandrii]
MPDQVTQFGVRRCARDASAQLPDILIIYANSGIGRTGNPYFGVLIQTQTVVQLRHLFAGHGVARLRGARAGGQGQLLFRRSDLGHELGHLDLMPPDGFTPISAQRGAQL